MFMPDPAASVTMQQKAYILLYGVLGGGGVVACYIFCRQLIHSKTSSSSADNVDQNPLGLVRVGYNFFFPRVLLEHRQLVLLH